MDIMVYDFFRMESKYMPIFNKELLSLVNFDIVKKIMRFTILLIIIFISIGYGTSVYAHPHMFYSTQAIYVFNDEGLESIVVKWEMDEYTSILTIDGYDNNKDGKLRDEELERLEREENQRIKEYNYYIYLKVNGKSIPLPEIKDFSIKESNDGNLIYSFRIPLKVNKSSHVDIAQYDSTYFTDLQPDDTTAVVINGGDDFDITSSIRMDDSISFYFDQFHPLEAHVSFEIKIPSENLNDISSKLINTDREILTVEGVDSEGVQLSDENIDTKVIKGEDHIEEFEVIENVDLKSSKNSFPNNNNTEIENKKLFIVGGLSEELNDNTPVIEDVNIGPPKGKYVEENQENDVQETIIDKINKIQDLLQIRIMSILKEGDKKIYYNQLLIVFFLVFAYGLIHVIGPGHGKSLTISYVVANGNKLKKALLLGALIPIIHSISGVIVVLIFTKLLELSVFTAMDRFTESTQLLSYGMMIILGLCIVIKSICDWQTKNLNRKSKKTRNNKSMIWAVIIVGIVPCPGVVFFLLLGSALGFFKFGILLSFFMMLGMVTGLTLLTLIAYFSRKSALYNLNKKKTGAANVENILELVGGLMIVGYSILFFITNLV